MPLLPTGAYIVNIIKISNLKFYSYISQKERYWFSETHLKRIFNAVVSVVNPVFP